MDDVLTMGRIGVDLYPEQVGVPLGEVRSFAKFLGGSPTNVAVAAARFGRRSAVITRTGDDPFGEYLRAALRGFGVDDRFVSAVPGLPTPVTFCEIFPPDHFPLWFYRYPKAPDLQIHEFELDLPAIRAAAIFWVTGTGLCDEPSRSATLAALRERAKAGITVLDLDYRPMFWADPEQARHWVRAALPEVTVAVGNLDECEIATGTRDPEAAADALHGYGVDLAIVKLGPGGVLASSRSGDRSGDPSGNRSGDPSGNRSGDPSGNRSGDPSGDRSGRQESAKIRVPPREVKVVNGLGAGDAFGGALCHGLLAGWEPAEVLRFANAAGALVAGRLACADAMPTDSEVRELLDAGDR